MEENQKNNEQKKKKQYILAGVLVALVIILAFLTYFLLTNGDKEDENELAYTELIQEINAGNVEKIEMTVGSTTLKVKLKDVEDNEKYTIEVTALTDVNIRYINRNKNYEKIIVKDDTDNCIIKEDRSFDTHIEMLKNNKAFYEKYLKSFIEEFEEMNQDNGNTTTIIHADLTPYNVIFLDRKLKGIIDFDNIRVSSREEEVIRFLTSISNRPELIAEFIRRYQIVSSDTLNLTESNIRYFVYKDLIEEIGIWYEKIATKSFTKDRSFYIENLANTIKRMNRVNRSIEKLETVVNQISIVEEERE